jgi:hypothetical protein
MSAAPGFAWVGALVAALVAGAALGFARAWSYAALGVAAAICLAIASRFASNDPLPGSEDMSWQILLLAIALEAGAVFVVAFAVGALARACLRPRAPSGS